MSFIVAGLSARFDPQRQRPREADEHRSLVPVLTRTETARQGWPPYLWSSAGVVLAPASWPDLGRATPEWGKPVAVHVGADSITVARLAYQAVKRELPQLVIGLCERARVIERSDQERS
jgi:hypothetical protein